MAKKNIPLPKLSAQQINKFWSKVIIKENGCWEWQGSINKPNYYGVWKPSQMSQIYVHRLAYKIYYLADPLELCVLHRCDNRICVNPFHLFLGTQLENVQDMIAKNRQVKGKAVPQCKLSEQDIKDIRKRYKSRTKGRSFYALAREYKVTPATISRAVHRVCWKHI